MYMYYKELKKNNLVGPLWLCQLSSARDFTQCVALFQLFFVQFKTEETWPVAPKEAFWRVYYM